MCRKEKKKGNANEHIVDATFEGSGRGEKAEGRNDVYVGSCAVHTLTAFFFFERATDVGERERYRGGIDGVFELAPFRVCKAALSPSSDLFFFFKSTELWVNFKKRKNRRT